MKLMAMEINYLWMMQIYLHYYLFLILALYLIKILFINKREKNYFLLKINIILKEKFLKELAVLI